MFQCKTCKSHEAHINALQHQIQTLEKLVFPAPRAQDVSLADAEADRLFETQSVTPEDTVNSEAGLLLSGDYDRVQEEF